MKRILMVALAAACAAANAVERRDLAAVPMTALVNETQKMDQEGRGLAFVWWVPTEFWIVAMKQDPKNTPDAIEQVQKAFEEYILLGVVEGVQTPLGAFDFAPRESVISRLHVRADGVEFHTVKKAKKDAQLVVDLMKPLLASMMGELGSQFHLVIFSSDKRRPPSGYDPVTVRVVLEATKDTKERLFEFVGPLDALHVPRSCPNDKEAHISWKFCPWDGTKLPD